MNVTARRSNQQVRPTDSHATPMDFAFNVSHPFLLAAGGIECEQAPLYGWHEDLAIRVRKICPHRGFKLDNPIYWW